MDMNQSGPVRTFEPVERCDVVTAFDRGHRREELISLSFFRLPIADRNQPGFFMTRHPDVLSSRRRRLGNDWSISGGTNNVYSAGSQWHPWPSRVCRTRIGRRCRISIARAAKRRMSVRRSAATASRLRSAKVAVVRRLKSHSPVWRVIALSPRFGTHVPAQVRQNG